jgi:hypothetical protein
MALVVLLTAFVNVDKAAAQESTYRFDIGGGLGMTGYLGDINTSNPFARPGFGAEGIFHYLINTRWAVRATLWGGSVSGDSKNMDNAFPNGQVYSFSGTTYGLDARIEFNFFNFGIGETYRKMKRWTPYVGVGLGAVVASCDGTSLGLSIPMALGLRYKLKPRINVGLEWTIAKTFTDRMDGKALDDPYLIKSSFLKNTDWYSSLMLTLTYEFGERCKSCFYVD